MSLFLITCVAAQPLIPYEGERPELTGPRCASVNGFSLHANTEIPAHRRKRAIGDRPRFLRQSGKDVMLLCQSSASLDDQIRRG